jgi:hypothetical protein
MLAMWVPSAIGGFFDALPATVPSLEGLLLSAHVWLAATFALMILAQLAKAFVKDPEQDPLATHPAQLAALARHRVLAAIPHTTLGFWCLFFVYFWQPLSACLDRLWLSVPAHLLTTGLVAISSGVAIGAVGSHLLRRAATMGIRNTALLVNISGGSAMTVFVVLLLAIVIVNEHAPVVFETLGDSVAVSYPLGMIPYAAALAADEGRWLALFGWFGLSGVLALWAFRATYRWSFSAHREIPIDLATPVRRVFAPVFTGHQGRWLPAGVSAFWRKDILVPYSREPKRYLFHQVNLLWWSIMSVILAMALRNRGIINAAFADTIPVLLTLSSMAILAMQNGVNALGREGKELTWLRPIFTGPQLFGHKLLVNWVYVVVHGVAYAIVVHAASVATLLGTAFWTLLFYAVGAGAVFSCLATAIGFLLPDFDHRRSSLPGSTATGKFAYMFGSLVLIVMTVTAHLLLAAGGFYGATYAGLLVFVGISAAVAIGLITAGGLRQYQGMEI